MKNRMLPMALALCFALSACAPRPAMGKDVVKVEFDQSGKVLNISVDPPETHDNEIVNQMLEDTRGTNKQGSTQFTLIKAGEQPPSAAGQVIITDESGDTTTNGIVDVSPNDVEAGLDAFGLLMFFTNPPKELAGPEDLLGLLGLVDMAKSPELKLSVSHGRESGSLQTQVHAAVVDRSSFALGEAPVLQLCALFWEVAASEGAEEPLDIHLNAYLDALTSTEEEAETVMGAFFGNFPVSLAKNPHIIPANRVSEPPEGLVGTIVYNAEASGNSPFAFQPFDTSENPCGFIDIYEDGHCRAVAVLQLCQAPD